MRVRRYWALVFLLVCLATGALLAWRFWFTPQGAVSAAPCTLAPRPAELSARPEGSRQATFSAPSSAEPLTPISVTVTIPGYSGRAEVRLYDGCLRPAGAWPLEVRDGVAIAQVEGRGALGKHPAVVLIDGQVAGVSESLFTLTAESGIETGQPRFDALYPQVREFMRHDVTEYSLDGYHVRGYRSPDDDLLYLRDHAYQARAFRYFEPDMTSLIDAFRRAQRPDGSFPDYLSRPELYVEAGRREVEADLEYLFVQAVYEAWQATGDDAWLRSNLEPMRRGITYLMTDPLRWDPGAQLVKRPFTIDTWDFEYGPTTIDPTSGKRAPRHWIDDRTIWGIFHGDNTGLAFALKLLGRIEAHLGEGEAAEREAAAAALIERLNQLSWNGRFFRHHVHLTPFQAPGVDESQQLSLSNAYALNREVLRPDQAQAIVAEYQRRFQTNKAAFAEWYSIDPPFPPMSFGLAGRTGERPGEYVNGGIMPLTGGELARGAFRFGAERYGFDILARYFRLISSSGESYLWYYPDGRPGISGPATLPTDGWGASAMLGALMEGAAGVEDMGALYRYARLSPRWAAAGDVRTARVVARYAASEGYVAYRWRRDPDRLTLDVTGSGERLTLRVLLPEGVQRVSAVTLDGRPQTYGLENVGDSRYVTIEAPSANGSIVIAW